MEILAINWYNTTVITVIGLLLVFVVLILLVGILKLFGVAMQPRVLVPRVVKTAPDEKVKVTPDTEMLEVDLPANASAAIAMAIYMYFNEQHDNESYKVTIRKIDRRYSPWSDKIYGINNLSR